MNRLRKNKPTAMALQDTDGTPYSDPKDVASIFKNYFATIFSQEGAPVLVNLPERFFDREISDACFLK